MADGTKIVYLYQGPADRSAYLGGIPARDLTEQDLAMLAPAKLEELETHIAAADEHPGADPLYVSPAKSRSQRQLHAHATTQGAELQASHDAPDPDAADPDAAPKAQKE